MHCFLQSLCVVVLVLSSTSAVNAADDDYSGLNVLCIGCSSGIGGSAAAILLKGGAQVVVSSRTQSKCDHVVSGYDRGYAIAADAGKPEELAALVKAARKAFRGPVTSLVWAPTGLAMAPWVADADTLVGSFKDQMNVNVYGLLRAVKLVEDDLLKAGKNGAVVSVSSVASFAPIFGLPAYSSAKAAQDILIKHMALEFAQHGVRVNSVQPAAINTPIFNAFGPAKDAVLKDFSWRHALDRMGTPDEVGHSIAFLLSSRAGFTTGTNVVIDGGASLFNSIVDVYAPYLIPPEKTLRGHRVFSPPKRTTGNKEDL